MEYNENKRRKYGNSGLYIVIACGLIAIGILAWFAASRMAKENDELQESNPSLITPSQDESYMDDNSSYNDSSIQSTPSEIVEQNVSDVPFEEANEVLAAPIMPIEAEIIKDYSDTALQYSATFDDLRLHTGIDIKSPLGTAVLASADGTVVSTEESSTLGKTVTIDHGSGILFKYCGLENITVSGGKTVKMGQSIGVVGSIPFECADEPHIHIEATQNGTVVSPLEIIGKLPK